jgi:hypothetical protein
MVAAIIIVCFVVTFTPIRPCGSYRDDKRGSLGLTYYEFKDGKVNLVISKGIEIRDGFDIRCIGAYDKLGNKWIYTTADGFKYELHSTCLSIRKVDLADMSELC